MSTRWKTWSPYLGLMVKDFGRIRLNLFVALGFSVLAAALLYSRQFAVMERFGNTQGTYMELLRRLIPYLCLVISAGFAKKLIGEDIDSQSWRFHQQLPVPLVALYFVKFFIGLFATVLTIWCLQLSFLFASKDEILMTWKHFAYPAVRLTAVAACVWSFVLLATSLGSFRWFAYVGLVFFYIQLGERVPPLNLISYEGSLEAVGELAATGPLIISTVITLTGLMIGLALAHFQRTAIVGFLYRRVPPIIKVSTITVLLILLVFGLDGLNQSDRDDIAEKNLTAFGQTIEMQSDELKLEVWMPNESDEALKGALRRALEKLPEAVSNFRGYVQLRSELPACVVILRPDLIDASDWQVDFYRDNQIVVIRLFPDFEHYDQLGDILAKYYAYSLLHEGLLHMPIGMENFGWLACGLPSYLSPIDPDVFFDEDESPNNAVDWLRDNEVSDWPETRDGFYDSDGSYNADPRLSINEMGLVSFAILEALRERHGSEWVEALCREAIVLDTSLPYDYEDLHKMLGKSWNELLGVAARAKFRPVLQLLQMRGGSEEGLTNEAVVLLEERLVE